MTENGQEMIMPVQPMGYGNFGGFGNGFGGFGGWGSDIWVILIVLFAMGGFGGMGWGGFGGGFNNMALGFDFPWLLNGQQGINANTNAGFNQQATANALGNLSTAVTSGFGDVQTALCGGFAGVNANVQNGFAQAEIANNSRQIANMQQAFNAQTAVTGAITDLASQQSNCCCEQRLATANLQNVIQTENCADRAAISDGIRDILTATQAQTQRILDQMCNDKIDAKNEKIVELQNQIAMKDLAASQVAQTAQLMQDNNAQTAALIQRIAPYPSPSFIVGNPYYSYPYYNNGYNGCGCGNNFGGFNGNF